ncbi:hypothetical protein AB0N16_34985 [Streptomyces sp. NPDC051105]
MNTSPASGPVALIDHQPLPYLHGHGNVLGPDREVSGGADSRAE